MSSGNEANEFERGTLDWFAVAVAVAAFIAIVRFKQGVVTIIGFGALAGILTKSFGLS